MSTEHTPAYQTIPGNEDVLIYPGITFNPELRQYLGARRIGFQAIAGRNGYISPLVVVTDEGTPFDIALKNIRYTYASRGEEIASGAFSSAVGRILDCSFEESSWAQYLPPRPN